LTRFEWRQRTAVADLVRRWRLVLISLLVILHVAVIGVVWLTPSFKASIASSSIAAEAGTAYVAALRFDKNFPYQLLADGMGAPYRSNLALFEDGKALGPSHSPHALIRERGAGRYSHWASSVIFSSSDGSDPRTNGRVYSLASPTTLNTPLRMALLATLALLDSVFFAWFREDILAFCRSRASIVFGSLALSVIAAAALSAFGAFGTVVVAASGAPKDAALAVHVLQHACLGCLISTGFWAAGAGVSRLASRDPKAGLSQILIPAFPVSLVLLAALATISLVIPHGRPIALALWVVCLFPLLNWRPPRQQLKAAMTAAFGIIPFAILFGIWLGLLWHGPTDTLPGSPSGDVTFYAGTIWSLANQPYPFIDLGYENGGAHGYFNSLLPALGAALLYLPGFDPFLFLLASCGTSYIVLSSLMLHLYVADRAPGSPGAFAVFILLLSFLVAARYPYWVVESIPVIFVPALAISVWWMMERGRNDFRWSIAAMIAGLGGSLLSKVTTAAVLLPLGAAGLWKQFRLAPYKVRAVAVGIAGVFGIYCIAMLAYFLPGMLGASAAGPESLRSPQWWFVARDAATFVLALLAWRIADAPVALALTLGLSTFLLFSFVFQINFVSVSLLLGLIAFSHPEKLARSRLLAFVAFALALPAVVLSDPAGTSSGGIWVVCLGSAVMLAISSAVHIGGGLPLLTLRASAAIAITALTFSGLGLVGIARGYVIADSGGHILGQELTPELKDIWSAVRRLTPSNALIFTDQVDESINVLGGWNTYAFSGQRQIFLSSYYTVFDLRNDKTKLRQVLAINDSVLRGATSPTEVATRSHYDSVFAIISKSRTAPAGWKHIYNNKNYTIFQIAP
jgi:hypothetical protein